MLRPGLSFSGVTDLSGLDTLPIGNQSGQLSQHGQAVGQSLRVKEGREGQRGLDQSRRRTAVRALPAPELDLLLAIRTPPLGRCCARPGPGARDVDPSCGF